MFEGVELLSAKSTQAHHSKNLKRNLVKDIFKTKGMDWIDTLTMYFRRNSNISLTVYELTKCIQMQKPKQTIKPPVQWFSFDSVEGIKPNQTEPFIPGTLQPAYNTKRVDGTGLSI